VCCTVVLCVLHSCAVCVALWRRNVTPLAPWGTFNTYTLLYCSTSKACLMRAICAWHACLWQGTSMAAPVVGGSAAIVRQYFAEGYYPSGARKEADAYANPSGRLCMVDGGQMLACSQVCGQVYGQIYGQVCGEVYHQVCGQVHGQSVVKSGSGLWKICGQALVKSVIRSVVSSMIRSMVSLWSGLWKIRGQALVKSVD